MNVQCLNRKRQKGSQIQRLLTMVTERAGSFGQNWWECGDGKKEPENASSFQAAGGSVGLG